MTQFIVKSSQQPRLTPIARELVMKELGVNSLSFQPRALKSGVFMVNDPVVCKVIEDLGLQKSLLCTEQTVPSEKMQKIVLQWGRGALYLDSIALEFLKLNNSPYVSLERGRLYLDYEVTFPHHPDGATFRGFRTDRLVIQAVEDMISRLPEMKKLIKLVEIPADAAWYITADPEVGGYETVREGRIWR